MVCLTVKHFNFSWQDMTVPSLQKMFDIVHIAVTELSNGGKVGQFYRLTLFFCTNITALHPRLLFIATLASVALVWPSLAF